MRDESQREKVILFVACGPLLFIGGCACACVCVCICARGSELADHTIDSKSNVQ